MRSVISFVISLYLIFKMLKISFQKCKNTKCKVICLYYCARSFPARWSTRLMVCRLQQTAAAGRCCTHGGPSWSHRFSTCPVRGSVAFSTSPALDFPLLFGSVSSEKAGTVLQSGFTFPTGPAKPEESGSGIPVRFGRLPVGTGQIQIWIQTSQFNRFVTVYRSVRPVYRPVWLVTGQIQFFSFLV